MRVVIPEPLLRLMRRKNQREAEHWLHKHKDHPWLQPHRVTLFVQENRFAPDLKPCSYFIRCPRYNAALDALENPFARVQQARERGDSDTPPNSPTISAHIANALWQKWEGPVVPPGTKRPEYPDTVDQADIMEIDEGDWIEYLRAAHKYSKKDTYCCVGPPRFPLYWTCTGMAFVDDQEAHNHADYDATNAFV